MLATLIPLFDEKMAVRAYSLFAQKKNFLLNPSLLGTGSLDGAGTILGLEVVESLGAGTLSEILAMQIPSILIPSPYVANNHQYYNALDLKEKKVSILIEEKDLDASEMYQRVQKLLSDKDEEYQNMQNNLARLDMKNSGILIYKAVKELLK